MNMFGIHLHSAFLEKFRKHRPPLIGQVLCVLHQVMMEHMLAGNQVLLKEKTEATIILKHTFHDLPIVPPPDSSSLLLDDQFLHKNRELQEAWDVLNFSKLSVS